MLAIVTGVLAQTPAPTQFTGVINDYTPATNTPAGSVGNARTVDFDVDREIRHGRLFRRP